MKGIGTDIIEIERIKKIRHQDRFIEKILSQQERNLYETFLHEQRKSEFLAGRWALKEAIYKALTDFCQDKSYSDFSILNDANGKPQLVEPIIENLYLSLSHCKHYTVAFVIAE